MTVPASRISVRVKVVIRGRGRCVILLLYGITLLGRIALLRCSLISRRSCVPLLRRISLGLRLLRGICALLLRRRILRSLRVLRRSGSRRGS